MSAGARVSEASPTASVGAPPTAPPEDNSGLVGLQLALLSLVRTDRDLTLRQLAVLLILTDPDAPRTVRGLASHLKIAKPAVSRCLDVLDAEKLARRGKDPEDRRSVLASATPLGAGMVLGLAAEFNGA